MWSENLIAGALAQQIFNRKYLVVVPNCTWTGYECDLLAITPNLRIVDVEVKISRVDLKADARKDKWFHSWNYKIDGPWTIDKTHADRRPRDWPKKVWKHYYAMPKDIWRADLVECMPANSGVLLLTERRGRIEVSSIRVAKPNPDAEKISAENAIDMARLASLRMWATYQRHRPQGFSIMEPDNAAVA